MTFTDSMKAELAKPLDKKNVKPPAPGKHGEYVEGWHVIAEANRIFGFDGWTRETVEMTLTAIVEDGGKWTAGYRAKVRVTVGDIVREGTGCGSGEKQRNPIEAHESAIKEAETDAMKRALMTFGNPFGLALYDKTKANVGTGEEFITDANRDLIQTTASAAGVTLQKICGAYGIENLTQLPADMFETVMESLRLTIEKNAAKAPVKVAA
jgi:DNA repair and recombination protein RAD52